MKDARWTAVDEYVDDLFSLNDPALGAALEASRAAGLPAISVTPSQGKLLYLLAKMQRAQAILEIGTLGGYSTIWLASALGPAGRLVTLEVDPRHAEVARANIANAGLAHLVDLRLGPAADTLPQLTGPFDFIFIDADKPGYPTYLTWALKLSRTGTVIVADNVVRDGEVANSDSDDPRARGVRKFLAQLAAEPRVSTTVVQTAGSKGYDGFALAIVTGETWRPGAADGGRRTGSPFTGQ
jgi:predicted O-methyltransferase YrrM